MTSGIRTNVDCFGASFCVRTEDCGRRQATIRTIVLHSDSVVARIDDSYAGVKLDRDALEERLSRQHTRVVTALRGGRLSLQQQAPVERPIAARKRRSGAMRSRRTLVLAIAFVVTSWSCAGLVLQAAIGVASSAHAGLPETASVSDVAAGAAAPPIEAVSLETLPAVAPAPPDPRPARRADIEPRGEAPSPKAGTAIRPRSAVSEPATPSKFRPTTPAVFVAHEPPAVKRPAVVERVLAGPDEAPGPVDVSTADPPSPAQRATVQVGQLVAIEEVDVEPRVTDWELPTYTRKAKRKKHAGRVGMDVLVDERGRVVQLRLDETIPGSDLTDAAVEAVWGWGFEPARKDGVAVSVWKPVAIEFAIGSGHTRVRLAR